MMIKKRFAQFIRPSCNMRCSKGFTLIEVMVALAIVGGLLVTLLYTVGHHLDVAARHETVTKAVLLAREKIGTIRAGTRKAEGDFPPPDQDYHWRVDVNQEDIQGVILFKLSVTVTNGDEKVVLHELMREGVFAQ